MSAHVLGLSRCGSCRSKELSIACPSCGAVCGEEITEDGTAMLEFRGVRCTGCGEERELLAYAIPEALTDFWVYDVRSMEKVGSVDFSVDSQRPTCLYLRGQRIEVVRLFFFLRVGQVLGKPGALPHGAYLVETEAGVCMLLAAAHELPGGEIAEGLTDWYLAEVDDDFHRLLQKRVRVPIAQRAAQRSAGDEGLLLNSNGYSVVYRIENALRTLVAYRLQGKAQGSAKWWEAVVSEDIRTQVDEVQRRRRDAAWFEVTQEHPMNFTTLGQLRSLLEKDWTTLGQGLGPKEVVLGALRKAEFYRNELAHCRPLTLRMVGDLHTVEHSLTRLFAFSGNQEAKEDAA